MMMSEYKTEKPAAGISDDISNILPPAPPHFHFDIPPRLA